VAVGDDETVSVRRIVAVGVYLPVLGVLSVLRALSAPVAVNLVAVDVDLEGRGHLFGASCDFPAHRCDILDALDRALGRPRLVGGASLISWTPWFVSSTASTTASSDDDGLERDDDLANDAGPSSIRAFVSRTVAICDSISAAAACVSSARSLTSFATTANPSPASPARAASMEDLRSTDRG